jgi:hypothetical protein
VTSLNDQFRIVNPGSPFQEQIHAFILDLPEAEAFVEPQRGVEALDVDAERLARVLLVPQQLKERSPLKAADLESKCSRAIRRGARRSAADPRRLFRGQILYFNILARTRGSGRFGKC